MSQQITPDLVYINPHKENLNKFEGPFFFFIDTDFNYTPTGDIYQDLSCNQEFARLYEIKQLGLVGASCLNACQSQTRGNHSFVTAIIMDLVLTRNDFSDEERQLGIAAGLYHDLGIVPCSDQGKLLKPGSYEEEDLVAHVIKQSETIKTALQKYHLDIDELLATIRGHGPIGELLNSEEGLDVDNLSYLAIDQTWLTWQEKSHPLSELKRKKGIFDQYNNLYFKNGCWVFDNPSLLADLLEFRALTYTFVYHNPSNRAKEAFLSRQLEEQHINLDDLITWTDLDFKHWSEETFGYQEASNFFAVGKQSFREINREYDLTRMEELRQTREAGTTVVERLKPPRNALKNYVFSPHDKSVVLLEDIPELTKSIKSTTSLIRDLDYIGVYEKSPFRLGFRSPIQIP